MKFKFLILALVVGLFAFPALAQDSTNTVSFNGFSFSFDSSLATNVNITQYPGDAVDLQQPGGPEVRNTEFDLYNALPAPSTFDAPGAIRVYRTADFAGYADQTARFQQLQTLLTERPDLSTFMVTANEDMTANALPFLPVMPASQVIRARAQYIDSAFVQGISYVTVFRQDASPFTGGEFIYTFQGVSLDGAYYVSAIFRLNTAVFPAEIPGDFDMDTFMATINDYFAQSVTQLNQATPQDFTPSLTTLDAMIQSFSFQPMTTTPDVPAPQPTATDENTDPTFGGLGGVTWTLVSSGSPDAPQAALPNAPVTLTFTDQGVNGSAGCNSYSGPFQYNAGALSFGELISTKMFCEGLMDQENAFLGALATASAFQVGNGQLQITYDGGVLTFTSAPGGLSGSWNLVSYGPPDAPQAVLPEAPVTLIFAGDTAGGNASCNTYSGLFQADATTGGIAFSNVVSTLMACTTPGVSEQETAYLAALNSATSYQVVNGQLQIAYNGGVLVYNPAA
jgi:heat shock protein HslJ